ncbi:hypothetical protein ACOSQ4_008252 [Xanthoceras sorbifolium]
MICELGGLPVGDSDPTAGMMWTAEVSTDGAVCIVQLFWAAADPATYKVLGKRSRIRIRECANCQTSAAFSRPLDENITALSPEWANLHKEMIFREMISFEFSLMVKVEACL